MAKQNTAKQEPKAPAPKTPDDFTSISSVDFEAWHVTTSGNTITGTVVDAKTMKDRKGNPRVVYIVRLEAPCIGVTKDDKDGSEYPAGSILALGETYGLRRLRPFVESQEGVRVHATPTEKVEIGHGNTMWKWSAGVKAGKARTVKLALGQLEADPEDDGRIAEPNF